MYFSPSPVGNIFILTRKYFAFLFSFFLVNVKNLKMYLQLFVTTSHLYQAVQAQRVPVSSTEVPRSIKRLLNTTQKGKGGLPKPPALLTQQGPCMALWARQALRGGDGSVLQQTFTTFPPFAELC